MMHLYTIIFLIGSSFGFTQEFKEKELKTEIKEATVFIQGAHVYRQGQVSVPSGKTVLQLKGLSPYINGKSINVKAKGNFTVLSVNHRLDFLSELKKSDKVDSLVSVIEKIDYRREEIKNDLEVLATKQDLMNTNKSLSGEDGVSIEELKKAVFFFESQTKEIKANQLSLKVEEKMLLKKREQLSREINDVNATNELPTSIVEIRVESRNTTSGEFEVSYPVQNAGWFPKYDIRVSDVSKPLNLEYKADVFQNTGVDWKDVKLKLSTADPNQSGVAPDLTPWYLNYERYTRFEYDGQLKTEDLAYELSEVVVTGYGSSSNSRGVYADQANEVKAKKAEVITATTVQKQTSFTFELDIPYSVKSNAEKLTVNLKKHEIAADYQYYAVPKLETDAFLIARLVGWDQYNLLAGEANLFFEGTYVGQTILDPKAFNDTLDISLGRDKSISISREKADEFSKRRTLGSNKVDSRGFEIKIRNQKIQKIKLKVFDQIPVSVISDISVEPIELSNGVFDEQSGKIVWEMVLEPQKQKNLLLQYEVKYPKKERVILE